MAFAVRRSRLPAGAKGARMFVLQSSSSSGRRRGRLLVVLLVVAISVVTGSSGSTANGRPAGGGVVRTDFGGEDAAATVAIQPDGKIVVAGSSAPSYSGSREYDEFALARYDSAGDLDSSFGADGKILWIGWDRDGGGHASALALRKDGRIVAGGGTDYGGGMQPGPYGEFTLVRLMSSGRFDRTFGDSGEETTGWAHGDDWANAILLEPSGAVVAVGTNWPIAEDAWGDPEATAPPRFALIRARTNGDLDRKFGNGGGTLTRFGKKSWDNAFGVALGHGGRIVAAGSSTLRGHRAAFALAGYRADGHLDPRFGNDGKVLTHFGPKTTDRGLAIVVQKNGRLVVGGVTCPTGGGTCAFALARYLPDGRLDPSFGKTGKVVTHREAGKGITLRALALQEDGKIVAAGGRSGVIVLARYMSSGDLDTSFGEGGLVETTAVTGTASAVAVAKDGTIVAAGSSRGDFMIVRYMPNGDLDDRFAGRES